MRRVLRQDPDVILIGEMRDEKTVRTALVPRADTEGRVAVAEVMVHRAGRLQVAVADRFNK